MPITIRQTRPKLSVVRRRKAQTTRDVTTTSTPSAGPVDRGSFGTAARNELKEYYTNQENIALYHNGSNGTTSGLATLHVNPLNNLATGSTAATRNGDHIRVKDITVRFWISNKNDRPNVMYRVIGVYSPTPSSVTAPTVAAVLSVGGGNYMTAFPNTAQYTVFYDKILNPSMDGTTIVPASATGKERSYFHEIVHKFNADVSYAGNQTIASTVYFAVIAYDAYGSLATDNIATYAQSSRSRFIEV